MVDETELSKFASTFTFLPTRYVVTGDENGDLTLRELLAPTVLRSLPMQLPVQDVCVAPGEAHILAPLRDGRLVVVAVDLQELAKQKGNRIV